MRNITIGRFIAAFTVTHQCIPSLGQPKFDIVIVEGSNIDCLRIVVGITAPKFSGTRIQGKIMRNKKKRKQQGAANKVCMSSYKKFNTETKP